MIKKIVLSSIFIAGALLVNAQYCNTFHKKYCQPAGNELFQYNAQSKSALFAIGKTSELNIIVYGGQDYRISLCTDKNLGERVEFKIYEEDKSTKKRDLLYDNSKDDYTSEIEFSNDYTIRLIIEVTVPDGSSAGKGNSVKDGGKGKSLQGSDMGCLGVLVEHMSTQKQGF